MDPAHCGSTEAQKLIPLCQRMRAAHHSLHSTQREAFMGRNHTVSGWHPLGSVLAGQQDRDPASPQEQRREEMGAAANGLLFYQFEAKLTLQVQQMSVSSHIQFDFRGWSKPEFDSNSLYLPCRFVYSPVLGKLLRNCSLLSKV